jgi:hypothetical protein
MHHQLARREYLSRLVSTAPAIAAGWNLGDYTKKTTSTDTRPVLEDFLVPEDALADTYELDLEYPEVGALQPDNYDGTLVSDCRSRKPWNRDQWVSYRCAQRGFKETLTVEGEEIHRSILRTLVLQPRETTDEPATTTADLHRLVLWDWFGGDPDAEDVTDWVKRERHETESPHRRTDAWDRMPVLTHEPATKALDDPSGKPCEEAAIAVATTEWGVMAVEHGITCPSERLESPKTVEQLMDGLQKRARNEPAPASKQGDAKW